MLKLADNLKLPLTIVTESIGILAKRRAGKSTTARRLAEQLHRAHQQVVVADPKGDWWGLLFARDGESPGQPFIVLGGEQTGASVATAALREHRRVGGHSDSCRGPNVAGRRHATSPPKGPASRVRPYRL